MLFSIISYIFLIHTQKKAWIPTIVVPRIEAVALPILIKRQREAHAEYKYSLCYFLQDTRVRIMYMRKRRT